MKRAMTQHESLPSALDPNQGVLSRLRDLRLAIFLDYDGTLTPIVARPDLAVMTTAMRETVQALAEHYPVAIVSGRDRTDVQQLVGLETLYYAGSHGFDIVGPRDAPIQHRVGDAFIPTLDRTEAHLHRRLRPIKGVMIERKVFSIAIHVRHVTDDDANEIETHIDAVLDQESELRKRHGKKVFELQPAIDWHKGQAVLWLLHALGLEERSVTSLYLGDDTTDEDAFQALAEEGCGLGILVAETARPTAAQFTLRDPQEVQAFLQQVTCQAANQGS